MSRKPSKPETRIEDYLDVMTGGNAVLPQPILRIEFYYAFLAGMTVELPQPILDDEKLLAKICGMDVEAPTYIPGLSPRLYAYMAKKGGQDVQVPDPILRLECYWYDYSAGEAPSVQEYTGAVPVTFVADGTPLLDLLISGNEEHSGAPTPNNPVMPEGCGERTGNLFDINATPTKYSQSTTVTVDGRTLTITGAWYIYYEIDVAPNTDYYVDWTIDYTEIQGRGTIAILTTSGQTIKQQDLLPFRFNSGENQRIRLYIYSGNNESTTVILSNIMLNLGSTPLPYEPYGYKIPISSANTTTPVYLGEVETTREVKKLVLTGEENITSGHLDYNLFNIPVNDYLRAPIISLICTHYRAQQNANSWNDVSDKHTCFYVGLTLEFKQLYIMDSSYSTVADFKSYLAQQYAAGTPVTVWYVLATSTTGIVNEPLMKIGDYSDTLSMEQAGVSIPTNNGSTTVDVETTVKPSEVYIKYRGEAVPTLSALPAEVSSPEETPEEKNPEEMEEE